MTPVHSEIIMSALNYTSWNSAALLLSALTLAYAVKVLYSQVSYSIAIHRHGAERMIEYPHRAFTFGYDLEHILNQSVKDGNSVAVRQTLFKQYGKTFAANWVGQRTIHTMDRDNIQTVLGSSASKFIMSPLRNKIADPILGQGLLTQDGEKWQRLRSIVMQVFSRRHIADLNSLEKHFQNFLSLLPRDGATVDLQPLFKRLFIDNGTEFLLGESVNSLCPEKAHKDVDKFLTSFEKVLRVLGQRLRMGHVRFLRGLDLDWKKDCAEVYAMLDKFIDRAEQRLELNKKSDADTKASNFLVDNLLLLTRDRTEIRTQIINVFLAGRDQIGIALSLCMFALARHPAVWDKVRAEVLATDAHITYESLKNMDYLRGVIYESFRLYSPVLRSIRHCKTDCVLPHGGGPTGSSPILVLKGTQVEMDFAHMHQDKEVWGDDAEHFVPERWNDRKASGWDYIPFLNGRRICPAKDMVLTQCSYVLARFAQEFRRVENRDPEPELVEDLRNVRQSRNGTFVALIS